MSEGTIQPQEQHKKKVFISYSRQDYLDSSNKPIDDSTVGTIVSALKGNGVDVWLDVSANYTGEYFSKVLAANILDSDAVVFLSSAKSNVSEWVSKEISFSIDNKKTIIPVKLDDTKYNLDFALGLSGIEAVEYYLGEEAGINKLLNTLKGNNTPSPSPRSHKKVNIKRIVTTTLGAVAVFLCVMGSFATFGFYDGYSSTRLNAEEAIGEAFKECKIAILNEHTIEYQGSTMTLIYDIRTGQPIIKQRESNFFDHITIKSVLTAISIPLAFDKLFMTAKYAGNGKSKAAFLIAGSIGILCGYSIGVPIGEENAKWHNEKDIRAYFERPTTKERISKYIENIYQ